MNMEELIETVMALPEQERLELARRIIAGLSYDRGVSDRTLQADSGIEDLITGKVTGLNEVEFRKALE